MAAVNYIYSISADTLNGKVNTVTLSEEIANSAITIAIDHITVVGDVLNIWFKAAISPTEESTLDVLVADHSGQLGVSDTPDTIIAQLTLEGRNLLARAKLGAVSYKQLGWQLGRGGYLGDRPVKVTPIVPATSGPQLSFLDPAFMDTAVGYFDLIDNSSWAIGTYISLNGKWFIYGTHFIEGATADVTIRNIQNAILDSKDPRHYPIVLPIIDPAFPNRLYIQSTMTGAIGNSYPLLVYHVPNHINFSITYIFTATTATATAGATYTNNGQIFTVTQTATGATTLSCTGTGLPTTTGTLTKASGTGDATIVFSAFTSPTGGPMVGGSSIVLDDPAWPTPPTLAPYTGTEGLIEMPATTAVSFMSRVGEGTAGIGAYGELGLWVRIIDSTFIPEIGNQVLYAISHFPIQPKTDRTILTFRVIVAF